MKHEAFQNTEGFRESIAHLLSALCNKFHIFQKQSSHTPSIELESMPQAVILVTVEGHYAFQPTGSTTDSHTPEYTLYINGYPFTGNGIEPVTVTIVTAEPNVPAIYSWQDADGSTQTSSTSQVDRKELHQYISPEYLGIQKKVNASIALKKGLGEY